MTNDQPRDPAATSEVATYDRSLPAIVARLRASIAWLRDGTPTRNGGIGLGDMIDMLPIMERALAAPTAVQAAGNAVALLSDSQLDAMWTKHCKANSVGGLTVVKPAAFARAVLAAHGIHAEKSPATDPFLQTR